MALPMVHLLAAQIWAQDKPELKSNPDYYLGTISPDAIHIRDGNDKSHKNEIHLNNWRSPDPDRVFQYWKEHHTPFDIGYGVHLLIDGQWAVRFRERLKGMLLPDGRPNPDIYYNDTCVTDFRFYNESGETQFLMDMVRQGNAPESHPMLTKHEFDEWQKEIFAFYQRPCPKNDPVRFVTMEYVEAFLRECMKMIDDTYGRFLKMNDTQRSILDRRSTRGFSDAALTEAEFQTLIDAAMASPTARNSQEWHFVFVKDKALNEEFAADFRKFMKAKTGEERFNNYDVYFNAPLVVYITVPEEPTTKFNQVDAGIAVQNLALSAHAMGMGSVIVGMPKQLLDSEAGAEWEKKLSFPEKHHFAIGIAIGHQTTTKEAHPIGEGKFTIIG